MTHFITYRLMTAARLPWLWPAAIALSALAVALVTFGDAGPPMRPAVALWFLIICPGMAFVRLLNVKETLTELSLAIALSLAFDAIVAGVMLYARLWSPEAGLVVLMVLSLAGAALQVILPRRQAPAE